MKVYNFMTSQDSSVQLVDQAVLLFTLGEEKEAESLLVEYLSKHVVDTRPSTTLRDVWRDLQCGSSRRGKRGRRGRRGYTVGGRFGGPRVECRRGPTSDVQGGMWWWRRALRVLCARDVVVLMFGF